MVFRVKVNFKLNNTEAKNMLLNKAKMSVVGYKNGPAELKLDSYCLNNFGLPLKKLCLLLIDNLSVSKGFNEYVMTFKNKKLSTLAAFIIYGNYEIKGSKILQYALFRKV